MHDDNEGYSRALVRVVLRGGPSSFLGVRMDIDKDAATIDGWLNIYYSAVDAGQTDAAVEAAEELDYLLRRPVPAP